MSRSDRVSICETCFKVYCTWTDNATILKLIKFNDILFLNFHNIAPTRMQNNSYLKLVKVCILSLSYISVWLTNLSYETQSVTSTTQSHCSYTDFWHSVLEQKWIMIYGPADSLLCLKTNFFANNSSLSYVHMLLKTVSNCDR